jgi:hypothetical protein
MSVFCSKHTGGAVQTSRFIKAISINTPPNYGLCKGKTMRKMIIRIKLKSRPGIFWYPIKKYDDNGMSIIYARNRPEAESDAWNNVKHVLYHLWMDEDVTDIQIISSH